MKPDLFDNTASFRSRHIGPSDDDLKGMLTYIGATSLEDLTAQTVPEAIRFRGLLDLPPALTEHEMLADLRRMSDTNQVFRSYIGLGYHDTLTPPVVQRNILENPGWYTQYTPYQAEIAQGRLEALLNYQTMVADLTGMAISNASLLDEGTAAAEAMTLSHRSAKRDAPTAYFVAASCHPQTIECVRLRAEPLGFSVVVGDPATFDFKATPVFGALVQYPDTFGAVHDYKAFVERAHAGHALVTVATDLLALTLLTPPGEWGADICVGNSQRFGVPLGYGGPHAAFFSTRDEHKRLMAGRLIGVSQDARGKRALRMALQTREQHIRREKATSNICTAQVLLAVCAQAYAVWHGPKGLTRIAQRVHTLARTLAAGLQQLGYKLHSERFFDTIRIDTDKTRRARLVHEAETSHINLRPIGEDAVGIALDETTTLADVQDLFSVFVHGGADQRTAPDARKLAAAQPAAVGGGFDRTSKFLTAQVFDSCHCEHELLRYIKRLEGRDLSMTTSMIPLGSCTMKLNAAAEMLSLTWPGFSRMHPFVPVSQARGYKELIDRLGQWLCAITGFAGCSLQPNSGAQGEYAGLLVIRAYHLARGDKHRVTCLIPSSAHGTNPASAVMAGMDVVVVNCLENGNIDVADLAAKAEQHKATLSALMVTYPSTHGVFEESIKDICALVHANGGQVYMDGANMNAQVGLCRPADIGADVCHINLHKTFCIPHGGGGPGMGPICCAAHLAPFLPGHPCVPGVGGSKAIGPVSAAPFGSASILTISYAYIGMMGPQGLKQATQVAILNANYMARRLDPYFTPRAKGTGTGMLKTTGIVFIGKQGRVAHEFILDLRPFEKSAHVMAEDVAKRLMDYGFHSPTLSWPVAGTLMIEPTESESKEELDRFCEAMIAIRTEIREIENGEADQVDNVLKNAPHPADVLLADEWTHPYSRRKAAFPAPWLEQQKFFPFVSRVNNVFGDRNLVCACEPIESYAK